MAEPDQDQGQGQARPGEAAPTAAFYDRLAEAYDRLFAYPRSMTKLQTAWLARICRPGPLLDLGCGTGRMFTPLAQAGFAPVGLDCSAKMLALARRAHPQTGLVRAEAGQGVPFAEAAFSTVICLHAVLSHVIDQAQRRVLVSEALRVLAPGGVFVLELPHPRTFPPENAPVGWRVFRPGILCRRVGPGLEELRLEEMGGLTSRVAVIEVAELKELLKGFAKAHLHPGFAGGRFEAEKGESMVVCAYK
jgi:SAM-dependent methyltransferase